MKETLGMVFLMALSCAGMAIVTGLMVITLVQYIGQQVAPPVAPQPPREPVRHHDAICSCMTCQMYRANPNGDVRYVPVGDCQCDQCMHERWFNNLRRS